MEAPHSVGIRPILGKRRPSLRGFKGKDPRNHGYDVQSKLEGSDRSRPDPAHPVSGDSASGRIRFDAGGKLPSAGDRFLIRLGGRADEKQLMTRIPGPSGPRFYSQTPKGPGQKSHFSFVPGLWGFCADSAS